MTVNSSYKRKMVVNNSLQERKDRAFAQGQRNLNSIFIDKSKNAELWDIDGNRYIDFSAGIAVVNTGHNNTHINNAIKDQVDKFSHTCFMVNPYESGVRLAEELNELVPIDNARTMYVTTGAEAVENSIKIARAYTKRSGVISFNGGFHGRTNMCLGLTGKNIPYKRGFGPFPNNIYHIPFPIEYYGITIDDSLKALNNLFSSTILPEEIAAMIIEPIQGEGGFNAAPIAFLATLRDLCTKHGIVLICDEIQTGFARTGTMFATEQYNIEPDLMILAKGLAGGFPLSAVVGKAEIMDAAGNLGGTFGGSPLGCVAALAVLEVIKAENLCQKALEIEKTVMTKLAELQQKYLSIIGDIRSSGAMIALELVKDGNPNNPDADLAKSIIRNAADKGLIILSCGTKGNTIRILTPLTIENDILNEGLQILENVIDELL